MAIDLIRNLVKCFHNPQVMLQVPQRSYKIEPGLLTDHCGLKVPQHFDCLNLCNKSKCQSLLGA
jgi:hypothetical protein